MDKYITAKLAAKQYGYSLAQIYRIPAHRLVNGGIFLLCEKDIADYCKSGPKPRAAPRTDMVVEWMKQHHAESWPIARIQKKMLISVNYRPAYRVVIAARRQLPALQIQLTIP